MATFSLISDESLSSYIREGLMAQRASDASDLAAETLIYLEELLCRHLRSEQLFVNDHGHYSLPTLAFLYQDALNAAGPRDQVSLLQKLGDTAFFLAALFPHVWSRRGLTESYFHDMGRAAYGSLSSFRLPNAAVFLELADRFSLAVRWVRDIFHPPLKQFS